MCFGFTYICFPYFNKYYNFFYEKNKFTINTQSTQSTQTNYSHSDNYQSSKIIRMKNKQDYSTDNYEILDLSQEELEDNNLIHFN
jgi:hypothetical protein